MVPALIIVSILLAVVALACVWLLSQRNALGGERDRLHGELAASQTQVRTYADELREMETKISDANTKLGVAEERVRGLMREHDVLQTEAKKAFDTAQNQAREAFKAMAGDVMKESSESFLKLAGEKFKVEQAEANKQLESREKAIDGLVRPIKETLEKYNTSLAEVEKARTEAYSGLREKLLQMAQSQQQLQAETRNLVTALRRPQVRGRWGEMQLRRVAELTGMIEHCDFSEQVHVQGEDEALRPDMLVKLPGGREIVIDAKTPIDAFLDATEATDEVVREAKLDQHVRQIEQKVSSLASKKYQEHFKSADFIVLFIPGESFLQPAVMRKPSLIDDALVKNVLIATPGTLYALLKAVAMGWREQQLAENAKKISEAGVELHKRLCVALGHVEKLRDSLHKTCEHFNKFIGSINSRVLVQAQVFEELGAKSNSEVPVEIHMIEPELSEMKALPAAEAGAAIVTEGE
ncbi:MAG: DNA recombination protein RmuC [Phycisphaeraceae bacterium]